MRSIIGQVDPATGKAVLSPEAERHLKVIRLRPGENIRIISGGRGYIYMACKVSPLELAFVQDDADRELPFFSVLALPLLKKDNFEFCLQKATELGVSEIRPFVSERVIKRISREEFERRRPRFEKIISEAVEQSNRTAIPVLRPLSSFKEAISAPADIRLLAYEDKALSAEYIKADIRPGGRVMCLIGPEGGFSPAEAGQAVGSGFQAVSLGKRILRAETAVVGMLAVIDYLGEKNG